MKQKGFTLFETMITLAIFSVLMLIVFNCWTQFQKISNKNEDKQDTNITFVNVYRNIDKYVTSATVRLFQCYAEKEVTATPSPNYDYDVFSGAHKDRRWFAFLLSRSINPITGQPQLDGNLVYNTIPNIESPTEPLSERLIYNTCVLYLLYYEPNHCGGFNYCPHKSLYRYVFRTEYNCYFGYNYDSNYENPTITDPKETHRITATQKFKHELDTRVKNILENPLNNEIARPSIIEKNIVDLKIDKNDEQIRFYLTLLRINDAERHFQIGTNYQLTNLASSTPVNYDNELKKYIESLSWVSIPRNTINNL